MMYPAAKSGIRSCAVALLLAGMCLLPAICAAQNILLYEDFENSDYPSKGWYEGFPDKSTTAEHKNGAHAYEAHFTPGARSVPSGRHLFTATDKVYISYWIKYSDNWVGSGLAYHPHEWNFLTTEDGPSQGPADTHLTTYVEQNGGRPRLAIQDGKNVDSGCVLLNNGSFVGCNGNFKTYPFTEKRSVSSANGLQGFLDLSDTYRTPGSTSGYYSARMWRADTIYFRNEPGPFYKNDWHFVEAYFELNNIVSGKGIPDGKIRYWLDGKLLINSDNILFRTASHPGMKFNQQLYGPYIGNGSTVDHKFWIDDLTIADGIPKK
jgi:hypothetical protein